MSYAHTLSFQIYMYTCVYIHTHTNTDTYACILMRTQCICMHPWCLSCIHIQVCTYTHILKKKPVNKIQTPTYAYICMHTRFMHTRCLFIHICISVHTYTHTYKPRYVYIHLDMHTLHLYAPTVSFHIHIYSRTHMYKNRHVYISKQTCIHVFIRTCAYMQIHVHTHVDLAYMYVNIRKHTCTRRTHICKLGVHICKYIPTHM